jgi:hypothetical protein
MYMYCLEPNRIYILSKYIFILDKFATLMTPNELMNVRGLIEVLKNIHLDNAGVDEANRLYHELNSLIQEFNLKKSVIVQELGKLRNDIDTLKDNPAALGQLENLRGKIRCINYITSGVTFKTPILDAVATLVEQKNPFSR